MALDSSTTERPGIVPIPTPPKPIAAIRIRGLYDSRTALARGRLQRKRANRYALLLSRTVPSSSAVGSREPICFR
jgi:hypothetical protein